MSLAAAETAVTPQEGGWFGHPRGLSTLFLTELWERLSYYGMRSILTLYMVAPAAAASGKAPGPGLGFSAEKAGDVYGWYTGLVYLTSVPGGWLADRYLGQYRSVLMGGIVIALGHFSLAFHSIQFFYAGLGLIVLGTGLLKPNVSTLVGGLYPKGDERRDAGFSIFYMGINLGAFLAPFVCGILGEEVDWHLGFAAAGVGMVLGVAQYAAGSKRVRPAMERLQTEKADRKRPGAASFRLNREEWKRIAVIAILFVFSVAFWAGFEQAGSSLTLFARRATNRWVGFLGRSFPSSLFQALNSIFIIVLAPVFGWLWRRLGGRQPSSPAKFSLGLLFLGLGFFLLVPAASMASSPGVLVSPFWLTGFYLFETLGELCLSPVGLSLTTKLAPAKLAGSMMGVWFLSIGIGNKIAGTLGGLYENVPLTTLFGWIGAAVIAAAVVLALLIRPIKNLAGGVR
jgi:POT family proton-dependent oligopeptide transporter